MTTLVCTTNIRVTLYSGFGDWNGGKVPSQSPSGLTDSQAPLGRDTFDIATAHIYDSQYDIGTTNIVSGGFLARPPRLAGQDANVVSAAAVGPRTSDGGCSIEDSKLEQQGLEPESNTFDAWRVGGSWIGNG